MKVPGFKMAPGQGVQGTNHRNYYYTYKIFKNLLQNHLARVLEISLVACPSDPSLVCSNKGLRVQDGPGPGGPRFEP